MRKIKDVLFQNGFRFNKKLGQNFITDENLLNSIVEKAGVNGDDTVVEIGAGAGTLTRALAAVAKRVITFEVDENLRPVLEETLAGLDNVSLFFSDVLKMSDDGLYKIIGGDFKVVANIPYYVTTPLVMRFLEESLRPSSITVMVQKEVADRFVAAAGTAEYGAITMAIKMYGDASVVGQVDKSNFYPVPNVDSSIVRIDVKDRYDSADKSLLSKLIKSAFAMRRKTFANNLTASFNMSKEQAENLLREKGFDPRIRGEALSIDDMIKISESPLFS